MIAKNSRETIRFIDKFISTDHSDNLLNELILETPDEAGPPWKKCIKYKTRNPKVGDFEDLQTIKKNLDFKTHEVKYENDLTEKTNSLDIEAKVKSSKRAEFPIRLRYLIRPCIKKVNFDEEDWVLVSENNSTRIWCEAFNIPCITITQAESRLFHKKNKHIKVESSNQNKDNKINTKDDNNNSNKVIIERFDSTSYAPRGSGELWVP